MSLQEIFTRDPWRWCTFQGSRDQVLLMGLENTFREKLEWLEETETLAIHLRAQKEKRDTASARVAETPASGE